MFSSAFQEKHNKVYQISVAEKYVIVLSLIMFYRNRAAVVYKMIGYVIYPFIYNIICLDYLGIL